MAFAQTLAARASHERTHNAVHDEPARDPPITAPFNTGILCPLQYGMAGQLCAVVLARISQITFPAFWDISIDLTMVSDSYKITENCNRLKSQYRVLFSEVEKILFKYDPIGIAYIDQKFLADNLDEYAPEVGAILPGFGAANSADDVAHIVREVFMDWFDGAAGPKANYEAPLLRFGKHGNGLKVSENSSREPPPFLKPPTPPLQGIQAFASKSPAVTETGNG